VPRKQFLAFLCLLLVADAVFVGVLVSATSSWRLGLPIGVAAIFVPVLFVVAIIAGIMRAGGWGTLARDFPACDPAPGTKRAMAPSFTVGCIPMNNAMEYAADDDHLHLTPLLTLGSICPAVSIPWEAVSFPDGGKPSTGVLTGGFVKISASGVGMKLPVDAVRRELGVRAAIQGADADAPG